MKAYLQSFARFLREAEDPSYYQDTFYFTLLISMTKEIGGSRDETKNDIRALPEVLTVTLVEPEKGGVQRDIGSKYLSTLKIHVRRPKGVDKNALMKSLVLRVSNLRGVSVLRYKERKPKQRKQAFHGKGSYVKRLEEKEYWQSDTHKAVLKQDFKELTGEGPQKKGGAPYDRDTDPDWESAPPGAPGGLEEAHLDEAMKTAADLPEDVVVVVMQDTNGEGFQVYYAMRDEPGVGLKAGDLDRMEAGIDIFGRVRGVKGKEAPYEGVYIVTSALARAGFGPLLYDVALEVAGENGLKPDTLEVSEQASAVWKHYATQRKDVASKPLVDTHEFDVVMPPARAERPEANAHLAHAYFKKDKSVTQELADQGKLIELKPGTEVRTPSPREELTDLAGELNIPIVKNQDLSRFDRLYEDVVIALRRKGSDLMAFDVQPELNQQIWDGDSHVRPGVKGALMDIVDEFLEGLDLDLDIKDIIITGSIANYNWSKFSDIDIHVLVDFADVNDNERMVKKFFDAVRSNWNKLHTILVKGHEVELYVQNEREPHVSTGVYSLMENEWIVRPKKVKPELDAPTATKKMRGLAREIDKLSLTYDAGHYERAFEMAERIKQKIKRMRRSGLEETGIYSPENLAFKMLRRSGDIEQLFSIYTQAYDKIYSLDQ